MEMLTRVLARHMYALDLHDLPLDKLGEHKARKLRGVRLATHAGTFNTDAVVSATETASGLFYVSHLLVTVEI